MTDLPQSTWAEIERSSVYFGGMTAGRYIGVGTLRNILVKARRSLPQNALLWALYDDALRLGGEALGGWTREDIHEYMLGEWAGWTECKALGRTRLKPNRRSSRLAKSEFGEFLEFIVKRFAEHGIVLRLPGEEA
jgi:hypothetical protein